MADDARGEGGGPGGVSLLVCMTCGREYQFQAGTSPPPDLRCEKCGSEVFRTFEDEPAPDEARADFQEQTERDLRTDDPEGEATQDDLHDLNP